MIRCKWTSRTWSGETGGADNHGKVKSNYTGLGMKLETIFENDLPSFCQQFLWKRIPKISAENLLIFQGLPSTGIECELFANLKIQGHRACVMGKRVLGIS